MNHQDWTCALVDELREKLSGLPGAETAGAYLLEVDADDTLGWVRHWLRCAEREVGPERASFVAAARDPQERMLVDLAYGRRRWGATLATRLADRASQVLDGEVAA